LPRNNADQARLARQLDTAVGAGSWDGLRTAISEFIAKSSVEPLNWGSLIRDLLVQMEKHHSGLTPAKKREAVDHVLGSSTAPDLLYSRMQSVIKTWARNPVGDDEAFTTPSPEGAVDQAATSSPSPVAAPRTPTSSVDRGFNEMRDLLVQLFDSVVATMVTDNSELSKEAKDIAAAVRAASGAEQFSQIAERLKKFSYRLHFVAEDQIELKAALLHLIQLIVDNISELVVEDQWLTGQIAVVRDLMQEPLNLRRLDDVERRMKDVIFKQSALKQSLNDAKDRLKAMLATFVDRLADFSESTSDYHDKIEHCATKISEANDISELSDVLDEVMRETRVIQLNAQRSRDELNQMRSRVSEAEAEVTRLHDELAHASEMVRHDPLTGALNRKGMNEALDAEVARSKRQNSKLCLALLDIDNFKKLNDSLGHAAGDAALVHLSKVVQETIRPEDTLARYGGEEFVVLLPDTPIENAVSAMVRVQRELTRRFFLHNNDKVLITFSCGVAELTEGEDPHEALKRADAGMYLAKRAGKNRVVPT
jgi:diguanylate cyclase